jgi:hypothetical protein
LPVVIGASWKLCHLAIIAELGVHSGMAICGVEYQSFCFLLGLPPTHARGLSSTRRNVTPLGAPLNWIVAPQCWTVKK